MKQALKPTMDLSTMDTFSVDLKRLWPQKYWCSWMLAWKSINKQVIGYFLIDQINAQTQAQLVRDAMNLLSQTAHSVKAVVCDGKFSNQSTATNLGCNFDLKNMKTFIEDEESGQQAQFLFDACHLFKKICETVLESRVQNDSPLPWESDQWAVRQPWPRFKKAQTDQHSSVPSFINWLVACGELSYSQTCHSDWAQNQYKWQRKSVF